MSEMPTRRDVLLGGAAATLAGTAHAQSAAPTILKLQRRSIEVNGKPASVFGIMQPDGTHGLVTEIGKPFRVRVQNGIDAPSLIHWHGLTPPWQQDGVPGISAPPIAAGATADYDFPLTSGGTYWMHSHQGFQEQSLMTAPLIIRDPRDPRDRQEIVVLLSDFSFTPAEEIMARLQRPAAEQTPRLAAMTPTKMPPMAQDTMSAEKPATAMPIGGMAMGASAKPDLNDVAYDAFLANDRTLADPFVSKVEPGGTVLLRIINGASMSAFHIDLGHLAGELIAVDGHAVVPVKGKVFPVTVAQRIDIQVVIPRGPAAYPVFAVLEGESRRTGIVLAAGNARIARITDQAALPATPLTLELERRLRATAPLAPRKPDRVHAVDLTGDMARYVWSINNVVWNKDTPPLPVAKGERVALVMTNKTMMSHPMHLHGHVFQVVEIDGRRLSGAMRDTILVPPRQRVVVAFDADNPGTWAFHCHLLYHMDAGMFQTVRYL
jgi:FtsP/CotA-like multicopper oxidase with cupredoxin domain